MHEDLIFGINEQGLNTLSIDIINYSDNILEIFQKIDNSYEDLNDVLKGSISSALADKYNNLRNNFDIVKKNVVAYSDELICLLAKTKNNEQVLVRMHNEYAANAKEKADNIRYQGGV